jgi:glycerol-3-phosphate acyltransferase PlsY
MSLSIGLGYLVGSIPFALFLARRWGSDLRRAGSGNLGAANVLRVSGVTAGVLVALLDIGKGAASVLLAERLVRDGSAAPAAAGLAAIVGHIYPVWLRCRGGKGVATACGVFSILTPLAAAPAFAVFVASVWITKYVSLGSVVASVVLPPFAYATGSPAPVVGAAAAASALVVFRHRSNIARLANGTERRIGASVTATEVVAGPDLGRPEA